MRKIICVGGIVADIMLSPVNKPTAYGKLAFAEKAVWTTGGCALNCSINLKKLGVPITLIGAVGNDPLGNWVFDQCTRVGIDINNIRVKTESTSFSVINIADNGDRSIIHHQGANACLDRNDIDFDLFREADFLYIGGVYGLNNFDRNLKEIVSRAKQVNSNIRILLDVIYDENIMNDSLIEDSYCYLDYFTPNYDEAKKLSRQEDLVKIATYFLEKGIKNIFITLGEDGLFFADKDGSCTIVGKKVKTVDTTGAGDAFVSGFLAVLYYGYDKRKALEIGNNIAAASTTVIGAAEGIYDFYDMISSFNRERRLS